MVQNRVCKFHIQPWMETIWFKYLQQTKIHTSRHTNMYIKKIMSHWITEEEIQFSGAKQF